MVFILQHDYILMKEYLQLNMSCTKCDFDNRLLAQRYPQSPMISSRLKLRQTASQFSSGVFWTQVRLCPGVVPLYLHLIWYILCKREEKSLWLIIISEQYTLYFPWRVWELLTFTIGLSPPRGPHSILPGSVSLYAWAVWVSSSRKTETLFSSLIIIQIIGLHWAIKKITTKRLGETS